MSTLRRIAGAALMLALALGMSGRAEAQNRRRIATFFQEDRAFDNWLFLDREACEEYNRGHPGFVNCTQSLTFMPGGKVRVVVTDIVNLGSYSIVGNQITVRTTGGDAPVEMVFRLTHNRRNLLRIREGGNRTGAFPEVWELRQE